MSFLIYWFALIGLIWFVKFWLYDVIINWDEFSQSIRKFF